MSDNKEKKGFAGLDSMVSKVERSKETKPDSDFDEAKRQPEWSEETSGQPSSVYTGQPGGGSGSSGKWLPISLAIGVLLLIVLLARPDKQSQSIPETNAATAPVPSEAVYNAPAPSPADVANNPPAPPSPPAPVEEPNVQPVPIPIQSNSSNEESMPPIGSGLTLDRSQIRYCLSEKVRMGAWQGQVNPNSETSVSAFNAAVNDYNSRCSNFRYFTRDLENVHTEIESNREALTQQGLTRAASNP